MIARSRRSRWSDLGVHDRRNTHRIGYDEARKERDAIWRQIAVHGPTPEMSNRAATLVRNLGPWTRETDVGIWADCAELRANVGAACTEHPVLERLLKQIELIRIEQYDHVGVARVLLSRLSLAYQLVQNSYDRHFEEAVKLDGDLASLFDGPLRRERSSPGVTWVEYCYRLLRLRLAILGRLNSVRRRYDALQEFSDRDPACLWHTSLEGVGMYARSGNLRDAERCLADLNNIMYGPPRPAMFNVMRQVRAEAIFYFARGEGDRAFAAFGHFMSLCEWYRSSSDVRFWRRVVAAFGLTPRSGDGRPVTTPSYSGERLVLFAELPRNE